MHFWQITHHARRHTNFSAIAQPKVLDRIARAVKMQRRILQRKRSKKTGAFMKLGALRWILPACLIAGAAWADRVAPVSVPSLSASYPHDPNSYTQGLLWHDGLLYESTGRYGHSTLSVRELKTGRVLQTTALDPKLFGEGLVLVGGELLQLTWKEHQLLVYDQATLRLKRSLPYAWEGWGAAYDGRHIIVSDGSDLLRFLDPVSYKEIRRIVVHDGDQPIDLLNELEYVQGEILANVYGSDRIARIQPTSGKVIGWLDLSHLYPEQQRVASDAVLNGIAYDAQRQMLMVTGKYWPKLFLIPVPSRILSPIPAK